MKIKNIVFVLAVIAFFGVSGVTLAATDYKGQPCVIPPDHAIYNFDGSKVVGCNKAADWEKAKADADARQANKLVVVSSGTVVSNGSVFDICPVFFGSLNCVIVDQTFKDTGMNYGRPNGMDFGAVTRQFPSLRIGQ